MTVDLRTRYLGLELRSPIVASAAPHNSDPVMARRLERAGVGAIVLPSLFEEEILAEEIGSTRSLEQGTEVFAEALDYFPAVQSFAGAADRYLAALERVKASVAIPVIASLNASSVGGWVDAMRGASRMPARTRSSSTCTTSRRIRGGPRPTWRRGTSSSSRPFAPRSRSRWRSSSARSTRRSPTSPQPPPAPGPTVSCCSIGSTSPTSTSSRSRSCPRLELSQPWEMRLPVRWIAILRPQLDPDVSLAATSGAHSGADVAKGLLVGADVVMMTSALLRHGPEHVASVEAELRAWMAEHEYASVSELRGSASAATVEDPSAFERANYMATLHSWASGQS